MWVTHLSSILLPFINAYLDINLKYIQILKLIIFNCIHN